MARLKYYNNDTGKWEYADSAFGNGGSGDDGSSIVEKELYGPSNRPELYANSMYVGDGTYVDRGNAVGFYRTYDIYIYGAQSIQYSGINKTAAATTAKSVFKKLDGTCVKSFKVFEGECTEVVPKDAYYVAFSIIGGEQGDLDTFYAKSITMPNLADDIVDGWYSVLGDQMNHLLSKATAKKICCIVDDDTADIASVQLLKAACDVNGIKATLSCLPFNFGKEGNAALKDTLLSMEKEGFQTVIHAYSQPEFWDDPKTYAADCESNLVWGMQEMEKAGFTDYKYWMARKWGMKCALAGGNTYEPADNTYGRFAIRRLSFGNDYTVEENGVSVTKENSTLSFESLKRYAREAATNNGWLVIMTHFSEWNKPNSEKGADGNYSKFSELINYLKNDLEYEFMTVGEAWSYRKAIYDVYDMF